MPTFVTGSARTGMSAAALSMTLERPAEAQGGDSLQVQLVCNGGTEDYKIPAGWSKGSVVGVVATGGSASSVLFHRKLPADLSAEPTSYTFSLVGTTNRDHQGGLVAYRDTDATSPVNTQTGTDHGDTLGNTIDPLPVTPSVGGTLVGYSWISAISTGSPEHDPATVQRWDVITSGSNKRRTRWSDEAGPAANTASPARRGTITYSSTATSSGRAAHTVAIAPGPSGALSVEHPLVETTAEVFAPTLQPGTAEVSYPLVASQAEVHAPTLSAGVAGFTHPLVETTAEVFAPSLQSDLSGIEHPLVGTTAEVFAPTVQPGAAEISHPSVESVAEVFAPTVDIEGSGISHPTVESVSEVFAPTLVPGNVEIAHPLVDSTAEVFPPSLVFDVTVNHPLVRSTPEVFAPTVANVRDMIIMPTTSSQARVFTIRVQDVITEERSGRRAERRLIRSVISGFHGPTLMRSLLYVSDKTGRELGELDGVTSLAFDVSNNRDATWKLDVSLRRSKANKDFSPLHDWVKPVVEMWIPPNPAINREGEWRRYPMGLYHFRTKGGRHIRVGSEYSLSGFSPEMLFVDDPVRTVMRVQKGAMILQTVKNMLLERGVPEAMINFPMHLDRPLSSPQVFDPFADESRGPRIRIINTLLNAGAFYALYCDRVGRYQTHKITDVMVHPHAIFYGPSVDGGEEIMLDEVDDTWDDEAFANAIVVSSQDPDQNPPITAVAENNNPDSPVSFRNLGYWKVKPVQMQTIADQESANIMAKAQLQAASAFHREVSYSTKPDPERVQREYHKIHIPRDDEVMDDIGPTIFDVTSFGGDLRGENNAPTELSFTASRREKV